MNYQKPREEESIRIVQDNKDNFTIKIFLGLDKSLFDLSILGLFFSFFIISLIPLFYLLYLLNHNPSKLFQVFPLLFVCIGINFIMILIFLDKSMVYYIIKINKLNKTIESRKDFIYFTLKNWRLPIDNIKEIKNEICSDSDGFTFTKYYSSKLLLKNDNKIEIYHANLLYLKKKKIEIVREEVDRLKYLLKSNLWI